MPISFKPLKGIAMTHSKLSRIVSVVITFVLVAAFAMPTMALAVKTEVEVDNHALAGDQDTVSGLVIDDVAAPNPGDVLDNTAKVSSAEGVEWEIPVLWIADNLELVTEAQEGRSYLPALTFFLPQGYSIDGSEFRVTLSDSLTELFGGSEIVSVYDADSDTTYILPASLRNYFVGAQQNTEGIWPDSEQAAPASESQKASESYVRSLVDIYCAQTARDACSDEDLEFFLDLVINKLEPQAVELLLDGFPAFRAAADQGQIGREIGLYVYYAKGDKDGIDEHEKTPTNALAYIRADTIEDGDNVKYCYMIGVDLSGLALLDDDDNPVMDSSTGKFMLIREGENMVAFENALMHAVFNAIMDDYNRTGMLGATDARDALTDEDGNFPTIELEARYNALHFPNWFIEGTASSVENVYQARYDKFKMLRAKQGSEKDFTKSYDKSGLLYNYLNTTSNDKDSYFDLGAANGCESSYLATLYLSELAAQKGGESAIKKTEDAVAISSERLRAGLNSILERMHNGETLDQVVNDLSPVDANGKKLYADTDDFEARFIKGVGKKTADGMVYSGDDSSIEFVTTFLNYMLALERADSSGARPNGSILMDFGSVLPSPLDNLKDAYSDFIQIVETNELVESTVPNEVALAGGGKSGRGTVTGSGKAVAKAAKAAQVGPEPAGEPAGGGGVAEPDAQAGAGESDEVVAVEAEAAQVDAEPTGGDAGDGVVAEPDAQAGAGEPDEVVAVEAGPAQVGPEPAGGDAGDSGVAEPDAQPEAES